MTDTEAIRNFEAWLTGCLHVFQGVTLCEKTLRLDGVSDATREQELRSLKALHSSYREALSAAAEFCPRFISIAIKCGQDATPFVTIQRAGEGQHIENLAVLDAAEKCLNAVTLMSATVKADSQQAPSALAVDWLAVSAAATAIDRASAEVDRLVKRHKLTDNGQRGTKRRIVPASAAQYLADRNKSADSAFG